MMSRYAGGDGSEEGRQTDKSGGLAGRHGRAGRKGREACWANRQVGHSKAWQAG